MQPVDRRDWQGSSGAGDRCAGRIDGPCGRCGGHPLQVVESQQGTRGAWASGAGRSLTISPGNANVVGGHAQPDACALPTVEDIETDRDGRVSAVVCCRRPAGWVCGGGADGRDIPARDHPYRRSPDPGWPNGRSAFSRPGADAQPIGLAAGTPEDGYTAAAGPANHRLGWIACRSRRRSCRSRSAR